MTSTRTFIEVAIVQPGPIQGGVMNPYLQRRQKLEDVTYPSNEVRKALERTLGVPIFQKQVMQVVMLATGNALHTLVSRRNALLIICAIVQTTRPRSGIRLAASCRLYWCWASRTHAGA